MQKRICFFLLFFSIFLSFFGFLSQKHPSATGVYWNIFCYLFMSSMLFA